MREGEKKAPWGVTERKKWNLENTRVRHLRTEPITRQAKRKNDKDRRRDLGGETTLMKWILENAVRHQAKKKRQGEGQNERG